jgi:hypothetical protein
MQLPEDGYKRGDTGAPGDKIPFSCITDCAPGVTDDQFVSNVERAYLISYAVVVGIAFDREFQIVIAVQAGERKGSLLFLPAIAVNGHIGGLSRDKRILGRLLEPDTPHIMGDGCNR